MGALDFGKRRQVVIWAGCDLPKVEEAMITKIEFERFSPPHIEAV